MLLGELNNLAHHPAAALDNRRQHDPGAERAHDLTALDRERLDHHGDEQITLRSAHHRERDAGVARRRLHDGLTRLEHAALLNILNNADREPVLHQTTRIERLDLDVHRHRR